MPIMEILLWKFMNCKGNFIFKAAVEYKQLQVLTGVCASKQH